MDQKRIRGEAQVWNRVLQPAQEPAREELRPLLVAVLENAAVYGALEKKQSGWAAEQLRQLYRLAREDAACIRGLHRLRFGTPVKEAVVPEPVQPGPRLLEGCFHRCRRAMTEFMSRSAEGEQGAVFRSLADRAQEQCVLLTRLLGTME